MINACEGKTKTQMPVKQIKLLMKDLKYTCENIYHKKLTIRIYQAVELEGSKLC